MSSQGTVMRIGMRLHALTTEERREAQAEMGLRDASRRPPLRAWVWGLGNAATREEGQEGKEGEEGRHCEWPVTLPTRSPAISPLEEARGG